MKPSPSKLRKENVSTMRLQRSLSWCKTHYIAVAFLVAMCEICLLWSKESAITYGSDNITAIRQQQQQSQTKGQLERDKQKVIMYAHILQTNRHPDATAIQLLKTTDFQELSYVATAIAQREGPPFSDMKFGAVNEKCPLASGNLVRCNCGKHKCFHNSHNAQMGYLVAGGNSRYKKMMTAFQREAHLMDTYGIQPLAAAEPFLMKNVSDAMLELLKVYGHDYHTPLVVQHVYKAPEPNLFVGSGRHKSKRTTMSIPTFARELMDSGGKATMDAFAARYKEELKRLYKVVKDPENLYLRHDWQCIISRKGYIYYIDLDRGLKDLDDYDKLQPKRIKEGMETIGKYLTTGLATNFTGLSDVGLFV